LSFEYDSLAKRRRGQRVIYSTRLNPKEVIKWRGWRCHDLPFVKIQAVSGTGKHLNHWVVYISYQGEVAMIVAASFLESAATDIAAATDAVLRGYAARGWQPLQYLKVPVNRKICELISLVLEKEHLEDDGSDPLGFFGHSSMLKIVRKIVKIKNAN
jgi:hypothetical protein